MVNFIQMIADAVKEVNEFKKDSLDALQKTYGEKMAKIAEIERQISEIPKTCVGKSQTFIDKKRKQLNEKLDKMNKSVDEWYEKQKQRITERIESMLADKKGAEE